MKCLLLLLASGLVTSEKLDRIYLPPTGSKYSGGTIDDLHPPLEFPKVTDTGTIENHPLAGTNPEQPLDGINSQDLINYSLKTYPKDFSQTTVFPTTRYQPTVQTLKSVPSFYGNFPPKTPSYGNFPSKQSTDDPQSYPVVNSNSGFESISSSNIRPTVDHKDTGYYYYVPQIQNYNTGLANQRSNNRSPIFEPVQFPRKVNNGYLSSEGQSHITTTATKNIAQNYNPDEFGSYGGNPMIMTFRNLIPQNLGIVGLTSSFRGSENNVPASPRNQRKFYGNKKSLKRPFQTPLVRPETNISTIPSKEEISTTAHDQIRPQFSLITTRPFPNDNVPTEPVQRNIIPVRPRTRYERPQTDSERNAVIVNYNNSISPEKYSYSYDTSNGIHAVESGTATNGVRATGSYSYTGDDGKIYTVTYTADENGFQPRGDHLPTASPMPQAKKKILEQADRDKAAGIIDNGSYNEKKYGHMNYQGAMDRYDSFQMGNGKFSRLAGTKKQPNGYFRNIDKNKFNGSPLYSYNDSKINEITNENQNTLQNLRSNNANETYVLENTFNGKKLLDIGSGSIFENHYQNKEAFNESNRKKITPVIDYQKTVMFQTQNSDVKFKPTNGNVDISNTQDQFGQKRVPSSNSKITLTDDGYYYVPPFIKFDPNTESPAFKMNSYVTTSKPILETIDPQANKRNGFNESQKRSNDAEGRTQFPFNVNTAATEPSRQPYISGPNDQDETKNQYNTQSDVPGEAARNNPETYPDYQNLSLYGFNTTPMTTQTIQESQPPNENENSQYYQTTTNPTATLPSVVENRINIPSGNNGITVSQDFVTTTYRPFISGDGVLEVNQNVKIYGLGKPETLTANNAYRDQVSKHILYSKTAPNGELTISEVYPDSYTGPVQGATMFQRVPNKSVPYGDQYLTPEISEVDSNIVTGPYPNSGFDGFDEAVRLPDFSAVLQNTFENPKLTPGQELGAPTALNQNQEPLGRIIVEDFNGPKQPQQFDPETGYYYK